MLIITKISPKKVYKESVMSNQGEKNDTKKRAKAKK